MRGEPEQGYHFSGKPEYQQLHVPSMHPLQCLHVVIGIDAHKS